MSGGNVIGGGNSRLKFGGEGMWDNEISDGGNIFNRGGKGRLWLFLFN
jgi:hypothetical protein